MYVGGKILLHNTNLRLGKGRRYGLMGKNGAGKTTLLTNIGSGQVSLSRTLRSHSITIAYIHYTLHRQHRGPSDDFEDRVCAAR